MTRKRVAVPTREMGIEGVTRRRFKSSTTKREAEAGAKPPPGRVNRHFSADGPDRLWVADITDVPTSVGWLSLGRLGDASCQRSQAGAMRELAGAGVVDGLARTTSSCSRVGTAKGTTEGPLLRLDHSVPSEAGCA